MSLALRLEVANNYSSPAQRIRVITEEWVSRAGFCPSCGRALSQFGNNKPVADFYCGNCSEEYELKSKNGNVGKKIVDGAYLTTIERLNSDNNPNFFFLTYDKSTLGVRNFLTIPKYFFVPSIIDPLPASPKYDKSLNADSKFTLSDLGEVPERSEWRWGAGWLQH